MWPSTYALFLLASQLPSPIASPEWEPTFGGHPGVGDVVHAMVTFDDGSGGGPALYAGGTITTAGGLAVSHVVKWDGAAWSPLGCGLDGTVAALAVYDDGSGPALFAGGVFNQAGGVPAQSIARWDGTNWSALGTGTDGNVSGLEVYDDGSGAQLYVTGSFTFAGGQFAKNIARWNGTTWGTVGGGLSSGGLALEVFDDGSGPALYVGGFFNQAGGVAALRVAKWDGTSWSGLGAGIGGTVISLVAHDDGNGPALFAGGFFSFVEGLPANNFARWDGTRWSTPSSGMDDRINELFEHDDGSGNALYAGGEFDVAGGVPASKIAKWDGTSWSPLGAGVYSFKTPVGSQFVGALGEYDDGTGKALFVGGEFESAGIVAVNNIAKLDGVHWSALGAGGVSDQVRALEVFDDGNGPALYAAGVFRGAGNAVNGIGRWDGGEWSPLGAGIRNGYISALEVYDDGSGPALFIGGLFNGLGVGDEKNVAQWDGTSWSALGTGTNNVVDALLVHDDGSGPALYASGNFSLAGGVSAKNIARWDGTSWSALGAGSGGRVLELASYDDGSGAGAALYAGGQFQSVGGAPIPFIAKWDGSSWSALGSGLNGTATALAVYDDGSGPALFVAGGTTVVGNQTLNNIAKWTAAGWSALGPVTGFAGPAVALEVHDDGSGAALYAGGHFSSVNGLAVQRIASWDGTSWSALGSGLSDTVNVLRSFDDGLGGGPALFVGGFFTAAPSGDSFLAKWGSGDGATSYCTAGVSASGCQATLGWSGTASATASSGFTLSATSVEGSKSGVFFFGTNGRQALAWGNGGSYRCVVNPVKRAGTMFGIGQTGTCCGYFAKDLNALWCPSCPKPNHNPGVGATVQAQLWYRDPQNTSSSTSSLSDAVEFQVGP